LNDENRKCNDMNRISGYDLTFYREEKIFVLGKYGLLGGGCGQSKIAPQN